MQGYILEGKKFVELPKKEMGRHDEKFSQTGPISWFAILEKE